MKILQTNKRYTRIVHIGDIHIRLLKRHDEYKQVFNNFLKDIAQYPGQETCIVISGDIFHSKTDLQPECINIASYFLGGCAKLFPTIIIAGNHDATLSNKSRLDSISPIIDALNNPNLFYLKSTDLYGFGNILFNNMSVFDPTENYIRGENIPSIYRNQYEHIIALFHGAVDNATSDTGYTVKNPAIMPPLFDGHHLALLGDIHKMQDMQDYDPDNSKPCIRYCGSLIVQNHGEFLTGHGYTLWNLSDYSYTHHDIPNDYGYFTVDIVNGRLCTSLLDLPKKVRLRVKCLNSNMSDVKAIIADIKTKSEVIEIAHVRVEQEQAKTDVIPFCKDIILTDLTNVNYQDKLITEFLTKKLGISSSTKLDDILTINRSTNQLIKQDDFVRNLKWKPIRFEFDNMFTYGEGNVIDFTQMDGIYGIFGPNRSGKSSILSAFLFCLFDKFERGFKGLHVLNTQKSSFRCKLEFEIAEVRYFIERTGTITPGGNVKVDVYFWRIKDGVEEPLRGNARSNTNDIIRNYIGTYDDFILTTMAFQNAKNSTSFIDMGNTERKDLLVQFVGLNIFDKLHDAGGERAKELNVALKLHKAKNYQVELQQSQNALNHANTLFTECEVRVNDLKLQIAAVNEQITKETANLIKLDSSVPTDLGQLNSQHTAAVTALLQKREFITKTKASLLEVESNQSSVESKIGDIEKSNLVESHKIYKDLSRKIAAAKQKIESKKIEIRTKLDKVEKLKTHKFDPACKYCTENQFVKDAYQAKKELENDKKESDAMMEEMDTLKKKFAEYEWVDKLYETYTTLLVEQGKLKSVQSSLSEKIIISNNDVEKLDAAIKTAVRQIEIYHRNETTVQSNVKIQLYIDEFRNTLTKLDVEFRKANRALMEVSEKRGHFSTEIDKLTATIKEIAAMEYESECYQHYLTAIGRDGIPYQVICNAVPEIEKEVNSILSQVVDYTVQFETDGKNIVPYVVYEHGRWPIELTSGYERFIASIAIRVALANISNLPMANFLALDEGMGTLDKEHLAIMPTFFSILKHSYDFILIISHLDNIRDAVDKQIEILHDGTTSKVVFE
jgi:DNA repair exonuclease SbcCD ATPase subunit/DNA repair exonuclease SbcCD nuclease subunit